jgi:thiamine-phosphate pyrophosphorylase
VIAFAQRSLYLCTPLRDDLTDFLAACLRGGVDIVQLREKSATPDEIARAAARCLEICHEFGVPFIINDSPELAANVRADGVHVGQDDVSVARCRDLLGDEAIVGLSTHAPDELDAALDQPVTYLSAGPIEATPTKPGRPGTGPDYVAAAVERASVPVFVTGGVTPERIEPLGRLGVRHFVVVRALTESSDPEASARALRVAIDQLGD